MIGFCLTEAVRGERAFFLLHIEMRRKREV